MSRRTLAFASLDEAVQDAERLLEAGYEKTGKWSLGQCCGHLAEWIRYPLDGYPQPPLLMRPMFWMVRKTIGPGMARKMMASGTMKPGLPTAPQSVPPQDADDATGVAKLRAMVERWKAHAGPYHPSTLFGPLSREEWEAGHRVHAAHHLSFLRPKHA